MTKITGRGLSRRDLLKATSAAALVSAVGAAFPSGVFAQGAGPEVRGVKLGYIALTDSAPLIIAKEKGFFTKHGLPDAAVEKQASWGTTRDNLVLGSAANGIDGAHILSPMPYFISTGKITQNNVPVPMYLLARLNLDAQAISVSNDYREFDVRADASRFRLGFERRRAQGKEPTAAMTFPGGTHDMWIRYWLASGGIDPDNDIRLIVVPPPQMVANMRVGNMDAFCVGEPWNEQLVNQDIGFTAITTGELWPLHPEKALGMRADWVERHPRATQAILMAVMEAAQWAERMENKAELAQILGRRQWFNVPPADILGRLRGDVNYGNGRRATGTTQYMKFWAHHANYPFKSHDAWFITENIRWGKFEATTDINALVDRVNREDLWREAARTLGVAAADIPASTSRGVETFFDGTRFDPANPAEYLRALRIKRVAV